MSNFMCFFAPTSTPKKSIPNYEAMLELLYDTRDSLEDTVATPDDPEVHAEYINKLKLMNQVIDLVREAHDKHEQEVVND